MNLQLDFSIHWAVFLRIINNQNMSDNKQLPLVSIISVNYNQAKICIETIKSLQKISYPDIEIIIVDNGSAENPDIIKEECPEIVFIKSDKNLGFAGGNNIGIREAKGKYVLLLNSDTEVYKDFLQPLVEVLEGDKNIGIVSPKLVYFFSENQKTLQYAGANNINLYCGRGSKIGFKAHDEGQFDDVRETKLPHGAAMMLPMRVIKEVGLMPDIYFLYYEEHDWAEMIKRKGYKIYYCGKSTVYHKESMSVGKQNPIKVYYMNRNRIIFLRRNAGFFTFILSFLFYTFISLPKNAFSFLIKRNLKFLNRLFAAYFWNLTHFNVKENPELNEKGEIINSKLKL